mgnify:CR=1 FL=1
MVSVKNYIHNIKHANNGNIIFHDNDKIFKQCLSTKLEWINEVAITKFLDHPHIIKFDKIM